MYIILIESAVICVFFTIVVIFGTKKNPARGLHNLPLAIQQRVNSLPEYSKVNRRNKILSTKERIIKKIPALIVVMFLFAGLIYLSGARTFLQGFLYSFVLWAIIKLYVTFVLNCGWYAHTPSVWIKGTENMKSEYQNYKFYMSSIPRSLAAGAAVGVVVGFVMFIINHALA